MNLSKTRTWNSATVAQGSYFDDEYDQIYANFDEVKGLFTHTDATVQTIYIDADSNVGIGTDTFPFISAPSVYGKSLSILETDGAKRSLFELGNNSTSIPDQSIFGQVSYVLGGDVGVWVAGYVEGTDEDSAGLQIGTRNLGGAAERMRLSASGNLGIGTTTPDKFLHIEDTASTVSGHQLVLESRYGAYGAGISFQSRTSAAGTRVEMARITADGEAPWNTTATNQDAGLLFFTTVDGVSAEKARITSGGLFRIQGLTASLDVQTDGSKNLTSVSDKNWKNDKGLIENGITILNKLKPRYFTWKRDAAGNTIRTVDSNEDIKQRIDYKKQFTDQPKLAGFFSQEVFAAFPEGAPGGANIDKDGVEHWGLNSRAILALSTKAIQELDARLKLLEAK